MTERTQDEVEGWAQAWPDALAFACGLAVAWFAHWETTDLVWSLWLSSLVVGYTLIVWSIFRPLVFIGVKAWPERAAIAGKMAVLPTALGVGGWLIGGLFILAFFTVHFGMFHYVHSVFLNSFFPVGPKGTGLVAPKLYGEVLTRYWWFLPAAFLAERRAFRLEPEPPSEPPDTSVTVAAIAARKARRAKKRLGGGGGGMMGPYKNVIRMHLLIFFFAFTHAMKWENFSVYAVVYAAYFFPWRLLGRNEAARQE